MIGHNRGKAGHAKNKRRFSRVPLALAMSVEISEGREKKCVEQTILNDVSPVGAGFYLKKEVLVGELLLLKIPLPNNFRTYNFDNRDYHVWAVVCHCRFVEEKGKYFVGTAFVGAFAPESFDNNPLTLYRITNSKNTSFSEITEIGLKADPDDFSSRKPRYPVPLSVYLAIYDDTGTIIAHEQTVTENISPGGAAVFSILPLEVGDKVSLMSEQYNVSITAEVCRVRTGEDGLPRLHLKFVSGKFPLHGIE